MIWGLWESRNNTVVSSLGLYALISHASEVMLKILQARLQRYINWEIPDVQVGFRKGRGTRDQIANICWIIEKAREYLLPQICFINYDKAFVWCWRLRVKWHKDTHTRWTKTQLRRRKKLRKQACGLLLYSPPWAEFQTMTKPSQYSACA